MADEFKLVIRIPFNFIKWEEDFNKTLGHYYL